MTTIGSRFAAGIVGGCTLFSLAAAFADPAPVAKPTPAPPVKPLPASPMAMTVQPRVVCAGEVPRGWIKVNDEWNPNACGNPKTRRYNVWTIEQYDDKPVGAVMQACSGSVPPGWTIVETMTIPAICGHPTDFSNNVMSIRREN